MWGFRIQIPNNKSPDTNFKRIKLAQLYYYKYNI